jgi:DNA-binding CsgD family transcriptional regulator
MQPRRPVQQVSIDALCMAFRISPAEARVLGALVSGETLADHAQAHGVSIHTVRKQIANLRDKMGCTRQVDMVRQALAVV